MVCTCYHNSLNHPTAAAAAAQDIPNSMRLLLHNLLQCNVKACSHPYPLAIQEAECTTSSSTDFSPALLLRLLREGRLHWPAFVETCHALGLPPLPSQGWGKELLPSQVGNGEGMDTDEHHHNSALHPPAALLEPDAEEREELIPLLQWIHKHLLETDIQQGKLHCTGCGHIYPIKDGIANMLLAEDEL